MTVTNINSRIVYDGNGVTINWPFAMGVPSASAIDVFITDDTGVIRQLTTLEFSVVISPLTGTNPTPQGGIVTYNPGGSPLPSGWTITIVRNLEPVQSTSIANQSIIYPPIVEREFDYLTMLIQQGVLDFDRAIKVPVADPPPADLPPQAARKNQTAFFNDNGDLVAGTPLDNTIMVSAAMQPVVQAATTTEALALLGGYPDPKLITAGYVLIPDDNNRLIVAQGSAYYLISAGNPTTYPIDFRVQIVNNDTRAKLMNIFGYPVQFKVYPDQQVVVNRSQSGWVISRPPRWAPRTPTNLYVDPSLGSDVVGVADGLAPGAGAFQTVARATSVQETDLDGDFTINLSNAFHNMPAGGLLLNKRLPGGNAYKLVGNVSNPSLVNIFATASTNGIVVADGAILSVAGITFSGGNSSSSIWINRGGVLNIVGDCIFGQNVGGYNIVMHAGYLNIDAGYHIAAGASAFSHIGAFYNSVVVIGKFQGPAIAITVNGGAAYTYYYQCQLNSTIVSIATLTYPGAGFVSGTKAIVYYNAVVNAGGANIPGTIAAEVGPGGFFF